MTIAPFDFFQAHRPQEPTFRKTDFSFLFSCRACVRSCVSLGGRYSSTLEARTGRSTIMARSELFWYEENKLQKLRKAVGFSNIPMGLVQLLDANTYVASICMGFKNISEMLPLYS